MTRMRSRCWSLIFPLLSPLEVGAEAGREVELEELVQFMFVFRDLLELQCTAVVPHLARDLFRVR